jgi:hypothetical protein
MAEVLIAGKDSRSRAYRRGDIVYIAPDGHTWGRRESLAVWVTEGNAAADYPGEFYILKVPGVSVSRLTQYLEKWTDTLDLGYRRLWRFLASELSTNLRNKLLNEGFLTVGVDFTRAQAEARLRRKDTEAAADLS